jgi:hypothetical protein
LSAWSDFKNNPSISNYLAWVRESYGTYADELEAQDAGVGSDVALLAGAAAEQTEEAAKNALESEIASAFGTELIRIIEEMGIALINAGNRTYDYLSLRIQPVRVEAVAVATAMTIYGITAFAIFNRIKKA